MAANANQPRSPWWPPDVVIPQHKPAEAEHERDGTQDHDGHPEEEDQKRERA
jgi:hypothetical protein